MKEFFKFMFASMLGFIIVLVIAFFILVGMIVSLASFADKKVVSVEPNSVLHIKFDKPIYDRAPKDPFSMFGSSGLSMEQAPGLNEILENIRKAKNDPNLQGILLDLSFIDAGLPTIREIRQALEDFKSSGKFIVAYGEVYAQGAYYLASVANQVYLHPMGAIELKGLSAQLFFIKGTLEKLDLEMQVIRHGKYKSAAELFMLDKMSQANREQLDAMIDGMWGTLAGDIAAGRNLTADQVNQAANTLDAFDADKAFKAGLVDELYYKDQLNDDLKSRLGLGEKDKLKLVTLGKYTLAPDPVRKSVSSNKIAVVYALGSIIDGKGDDLTIGSVKMSEAIRQARKNDKVKAIVLRVNSPGGSATASEVIRREIELAVREKPVIVSMGDVAASGGYWISAPASKILADPSTITGSIGVFGIFPNMQKFFSNKLGITFDHVKTNVYSDFPNVSRPLSSYETMIIEKQIDGIYEEFLDLVSDGRKMDRSQVDSVGQGRVWSGIDAKRLGLIDQYGGLQDAVDLAAEMAEISEYNLWNLPAQKDPFQQLLDELTGNVSDARMRNQLGEFYGYYRYLEQIRDVKGVQARLPFDITIQ